MIDRAEIEIEGRCTHEHTKLEEEENGVKFFICLDCGHEWEEVCQ